MTPEQIAEHRGWAIGGSGKRITKLLDEIERLQRYEQAYGRLGLAGQLPMTAMLTTIDREAAETGEDGNHA